MRTTIELDEAHRAELLKIAASRGEKGFSSVVRDAVSYYLEHHARRTDAVRAALGVRGALDQADGDALMAEAQRVRENWR